MSDERLRELERAWTASGSMDDEVAFMRERLRSGSLRQADLESAAFAGHVPSRLFNGDRTGPWCYEKHAGTGASDCPRPKHHHHDHRCHLDNPPFALWCAQWGLTRPIEHVVLLAQCAAQAAFKSLPDDHELLPAIRKALEIVDDWIEAARLSAPRALLASIAGSAFHVSGKVASLTWATTPACLVGLITNRGDPAPRSSFGTTLQIALLDALPRRDYLGRPISMAHVPAWFHEQILLQFIERLLGPAHARSEVVPVRQPMRVLALQPIPQPDLREPPYPTDEGASQ